MPRFAILLLSLPILTSSLELSEIVGKFGNATIPDTVDYRVESRIEIAGTTISTIATIAQAGSERQRIETEFGGRSVRIIRNGARQQILDLASGDAQTVPVSSRADDALNQMRKLSTETWTVPIRVKDDLWTLGQTSGLDSTTAGRTIVWSTSLEAPVALIQWTPKGDTVHTSIEWTRIDQRRVPTSIRIASTAAGRPTTMDLLFSDWRFPHSYPSGFFAIP